MEHLALEIFNTSGDGSKFANLPDNSSITIIDTSEIFAIGDVWSYSFTLNIPANAHIFGTAGELRGSMLHDLINKRRARLWIEGNPVYLGFLKLSDEADVDKSGNVSIVFESGQKTFENMIEGAKANQVPLMSSVPFGVALWRERRSRIYGTVGITTFFNVAGWGQLVRASDWLLTKDGETTMLWEVDGDKSVMQRWPRMVYPKGTFKKLVKKDVWDGEVSIDDINTDNPYTEDEDGTPTYPYCNIALCYQKHGYEKKRADGKIINDYSSEPDAIRGYEVMPANRVNSAPNFFVIYWLRSLMKHLGIHVDENQMMDVEDLRRLFFVNTKCAYQEPTGGRYSSEEDGIERYESIPNYYIPGHFIPLLPATGVVDGSQSKVFPKEGTLEISNLRSNWFPEGTVSIDHIELWFNSLAYGEYNPTEYFHRAYATSDCFPDVNISEVIDAIENAFGVRFLFSDDYRRVRIILLRNIFRSHDVQKLDCQVISCTKRENSIRGFRMTYGEKEDTAFYYKGFADKLPHQKTLWPDTSDKHDYSNWKLDANYADIISHVSAFDKTCYVTPLTGNAYGIKIDKDGKRYEELHPAVFQFAGYMDAEDGDCSGEEDTIKTINMGFTPAIMNDVATKENNTDGKQNFALFVDEKMRPRRPDLKDGKDYNAPDVAYDYGQMYALYGPGGSSEDMSSDGIVKPGEFTIASDTVKTTTGISGTAQLSINALITTLYIWFDYKMDIDATILEGYRMYLQDNYEPNDDGVCPIETHDWGLTLGIMRGSGSDKTTKYDIDPQDTENLSWEIVPGSSATAHPDTCDDYGNEWDYNGSEEGIGSRDGRISLKLRAEKPNPKFDPTKPESEQKEPRYLQIDTPSLKGRGLCDQFYKEYSYWVRNARIAVMEVNLTFAQLTSIDKTKKVTIGGLTGFVRKMEYSINTKTGLGIVKIELLYL